MSVTEQHVAELAAKNAAEISALVRDFADGHAERSSVPTERKDAAWERDFNAHKATFRDSLLAMIERHRVAENDLSRQVEAPVDHAEDEAAPAAAQESAA